MARRRTRKLTGITQFRDPEAGTTMASVEELAVAPDGVSHRIGSVGDAAAVWAVQSRHPAVIQYTNQVIDARKAHEYRLSPPQAVPKPEPSKRPTMVCPLCQGSREEDTGTRRHVCRQCRGRGRVEQS